MRISARIIIVIIINYNVQTGLLKGTLMTYFIGSTGRKARVFYINNIPRSNYENLTLRQPEEY